MPEITFIRSLSVDYLAHLQVLASWRAYLEPADRTLDIPIRRAINDLKHVRIQCVRDAVPGVCSSGVVIQESCVYSCLPWQ